MEDFILEAIGVILDPILDDLLGCLIGAVIPGTSHSRIQPTLGHYLNENNSGNRGTAGPGLPGVPHEAD